MPKSLDAESVQVYLKGDLLDRFLRFTKANPGMSRSKAAALLIDQGLCVQCPETIQQMRRRWMEYPIGEASETL